MEYILFIDRFHYLLLYRLLCIGRLLAVASDNEKQEQEQHKQYPWQ